MSSARYPSDPVLIVDDERQILSSVSVTLNIAGINNLVLCQDSREVEKLLARQKYSAITLDLYMPHVSGEDLLPIILQNYPDIPVVVVTGADDLQIAVDCMKAGAFDYLVKPVEKARLVTTVRHAIESWEIRNENLLLKERLLSDKLENPEAFSCIITQSGAMRSIYQYVEAIAATSLPILITGETGVGKELLARAIHDVSSRSGEFVAVNVAGLDDMLFADTLFGHKKGAFTGAASDRNGMIGRASRGTLFLDEIGDLAIESQIKLLRLLQEKEYYPLGADIALSTDTRFIFATNHELEEALEKGSFRKDLYYRLRSHHIHIPSLRERKEDIPLLVDHFLEKASKDIKKKKPSTPKELITLLKVYDFPGNVRELEGLIYDAVVRHDSGILSLKHIKSVLEHKIPAFSEKQKTQDATAEIQNGDNPFASLSTLPTLKKATEMLIEESLRRSERNQTIAAKILGMDRTALNKRLKR